MKKIKFLGTAILAASLLFAGCSSPVEDVVTEEDTSVTLSPEETGSNSGTTTGGTTTGGSTTGGTSNGGSTGGGSSTGGSTEPVINYDAPDLSTYYKNYLVSSPRQATNRTVGDWTSGSANSDNEDGTWNLVSAHLWNGSEGVCAALTGLDEGTFANYEYIVFTVDTTNFVIETGDGNKGVNVKVAKSGTSIGDQKSVIANCVSNENVKTYYAPISLFANDVLAVSNEAAIIIGGTGTLKLNEVYLAAAEDPNGRSITGITITPSSEILAQGRTKQFTVKDSNLVNRTNEVTYTLSGDVETGSSITTEGLFTAGTNPGSLTVTATYTVNGREITDTATIIILGDIDNYITNVSATCDHYSTDGNWTNISDTTTIEVDDNVVSFTKPAATYEDWRAQVLINTDADVAEGDTWYFSCKLSGVNGNYIIKLNNDESLIAQQTGSFTEEGTVVSFSGTSSVDHTDFPVMFGIGNTPAGTIVISDIIFTTVNE